MKALVLHLAKSLVDKPEQVEVTESEEGGERPVTKLMLRVAEEDKGKIIGKQGKVIKALRTLAGVAAMKKDRQVVLDLE